jgi:hypothetical protein
MLSHEPKNYALLTYHGALLLRGVAFRSSRAEPYGEAFLRGALARLLAGDVAGVRDLYLNTLAALRRRELAAFELSSAVRLTKTPAQYRALRDTRRELPYEAMLAAGRANWSLGDRVRVYRTQSGTGAVIEEPADPRRDYDVGHYTRVLRDTFAARLERAFRPEDYAAIFGDGEQLSLFAPPIESIRTVLSAAP